VTPGASPRLIGIILGLALAGASTAGGQERIPEPPPMRPPEPAILVSGSGTASARHDTAEVGAGVITQAATAADAMALNNARMEKMRSAVAALGIADRDVQTTSISVAPQRRQGRADGQQPSPTVG